MILVTGGSGFVGTAVVTQLVREGHRVRCLVRQPERARHLQTAGAEVVKGDVTEPSSLSAALQGMAYVIHLVGIIHEQGKYTFSRVHVEGTRNILTACQQAPAPIKRFIHMSALGTRENASSRYHQTKWEAEELVRNSGLKYTIFRPSLIFGKESEFFKLLKVLVTLPPITPVIGNGKNRFQPVSVKDVAKCFMKALDNPDAVQQTFELGGPDAFTYEALLELVANHLKKKRLRIHFPVSWITPFAWLGEKLLPNPPLTTDQLIMLKEDNICDNSPLLRVFAIKLQPLASSLSDIYPLKTS